MQHQRKRYVLNKPDAKIAAERHIMRFPGLRRRN
jgi:hypothetical protein